MGKKEETVRVVLDTNVLISSILFKGELARIVDLWKNGKIVTVVSRETFDEFRAALGYPKFRLTKGEIKSIIEEEVLPFFEIVETAAGKSEICRDRDDDKFIAYALSASADFIVSGDKNLGDVGAYGTIKMIRPSDLLKIVD